MKQLTLTQATEADLPWMAALLTSTLHRLFNTENLTVDLLHPLKKLAVARDGGDPVGAAVWMVVEDEATLTGIAVAPECQGRGIGKRLLQEVIDDCRTHNAAHIVLEVREDNTSALALYQNQGFHMVGRRKAYYQPEGIDALLLRLDLPK